LNNDFVLIKGEVPYYQSRLFNENNIKHAFFTRNGGVRKGAFSSLNFAVGNAEIKDSEQNVFENHRIAANVFGLDVKDVCRSNQTHTSVVLTVTDKDRGRGLTIPGYESGVDGLVTCEKNLLLSIRTADCVPVLLFDKEKKACAAVHAGWRGTVGGITKNAVAIMEEKGAKRENILAAIGPCIGLCCYEVSLDVYNEFISVSADYSSFFKPVGDKFMLDLTLANEFILKEAGIPDENISCADLCTKCNEADFFSHRRSGGVRGTMSAMICL
jgi:YfiH family protein